MLLEILSTSTLLCILVGISVSSVPRAVLSFETHSSNRGTTPGVTFLDAPSIYRPPMGHLSLDIFSRIFGKETGNGATARWTWRIAAFAQDKVNLPKEEADEYRAQTRRLREKLEGYLGEHPDFTLKKMLLSGSLAKGTALRSLNDIDVACYIRGADAPKDIQALLDFLPSAP